MADRVEIFAVGASAGGVEALTELLRGLPPGLPAAVLIVLHVSETSVLAQILARATSLPVHPGSDGLAIEPGAVYVAPPNRHMIVEDGHLRLERGPRENGHRPAVDPLMRSVAAAYGARAAGVILSGARDDGTLGMADIKRAGGFAIVQDPDEATVPGMPASAARNVAVDAVLPVTRMGAVFLDLATTGRLSDNGSATMPERADPPHLVGLQASPYTTFACPGCGGVLIEQPGAGVTHFTCQVGHQYSLDSLVDEHADMVETALWAAVRSLEERSKLLRRVADRMNEGPGRERVLEEAADCEQKAQLIRATVESLRSTTEIAQ